MALGSNLAQMSSWPWVSSRPPPSACSSLILLLQFHLFSEHMNWHTSLPLPFLHHTFTYHDGTDPSGTLQPCLWMSVSSQSAQPDRYLINDQFFCECNSFTGTSVFFFFFFFLLYVFSSLSLEQPTKTKVCLKSNLFNRQPSKPFWDLLNMALKMFNGKITMTEVLTLIRNPKVSKEDSGGMMTPAELW